MVHKMPNCEGCGGPIPQARLDAMTGATLCVDCQGKNDVPPVRGCMSWSHKTAPEIIIGPEADTLRAFDRKGCHAQLPLGNRENFYTQTAEQTRHAISNLREKPLIKMQATVKVARARCHPDRPRVTPTGHCEECAVNWYARRRRG